MKMLFAFLFVFAFNAYGLENSCDKVAAAEPMNCVNPGGSCNGSVPCCDANNNACFRGRCQPMNRLALLELSAGAACEGIACGPGMASCYYPCSCDGIYCVLH